MGFNSVFKGLRREAVTAGKNLTANPEGTKRLERRSVLVFQRSSHHTAVCLTARPQTLPKPVLHRVRSSASSFTLQHLLLSLRSTSSCWRVLPLLPVISSFHITCFRRQFLRKIWAILSAILLFIVCTYVGCSFPLLHPSPTSHFKTLQVFLIYPLKCPSFSTIQIYAPNITFHYFLLSI